MNSFLKTRKSTVDSISVSTGGKDLIVRLLRNKLVLICLILLIALVMAAILAPLIAPFDPNEQYLSGALQSPSWTHLMGTDEMGRDIFSRVLFGARISLPIAGAVVAISFIVGLAIGSIAGYVGGWTDGLLSRIIDVFISFPGIIMSLVLIGFMGPGFVNMIVALSITSWAGYARLMRGQVLSVKNNDYVSSSKLIGESKFRIMFKHIIPNSIAPVIVLATIDMGHVILASASLSYLGLGIPADIPEWGSMINAGQDYIRTAPWVIIGPGLAITFTVMIFCLLGDGLRDVMDPKSDEEGVIGAS